MLPQSTISPPSVLGLERLFADGHLGSALLKRFGGKIGHTYPMKDSEFIITYEGSAIPTIDAIESAVRDAYEHLGYEVRQPFVGIRAHFCAMVEVNRGTRDWHAFTVTITPATEPKAHVWVTCSRI